MRKKFDQKKRVSTKVLLRKRKFPQRRVYSQFSLKAILQYIQQVNPILYSRIESEVLDMNLIKMLTVEQGKTSVRRRTTPRRGLLQIVFSDNRTTSIDIDDMPFPFPKKPKNSIKVTNKSLKKKK